VADKLMKAVEPFGCQLVEGVMSHDLRQFVIDGSKVRPNPSTLPPPCFHLAPGWLQSSFFLDS
jgi:hypothetical protein